MRNWMASTYFTSKNTIRLCDIVDNFVENSENSLKRFDLWDFDYPSYYQGEEKKAFEQKVIDHFYLREIGFETVGRFKHYFKCKVREIMPYYIQLYNSQELMQAIEDPFGNVNVTETFTQTRTGESSGTSSGSATSENAKSSDSDFTKKFSNTPQGSITNLEKYMTEGTTESTTVDGLENLSQESQSSSTGSSSETVEHTFTKVGNQGVNTYAHDMKELRETFLNIDMMIINDLSELFLKIY